MNEWDKIWKRRSMDIEITDDVFDMFCKLKCADGFDTQNVEGYYEAFYQEWNETVSYTHLTLPTNSRV